MERVTSKMIPAGRTPLRNKTNENMDDNRQLGAVRKTGSASKSRRQRRKVCDLGRKLLDTEVLHDAEDEPCRMGSSDDPISERLKAERQKAYDVLNKPIAFKISPNDSLPDNEESQAPSPKRLVLGSTRSDLIPQRKNDVFNISDLVADHTLDIKSMSSISSTINKVSFEPSEMTGRSTMCTARSSRTANVKVLSVKEILAQSIVDDVRSLSETLPSFERTVDNIPDRERSLTSGCRTSFPPSMQDDGSELFGESFKPAELMGSRLSADERSWEQQFAAIPTCFKSDSDLSPECLQKQRSDKSEENYNFSIGDFFNKHSDSIRDIVPGVKSPEKRPPIALRDDSTLSERINSILQSSKGSTDMLTPKIDNKTYSRYIRPIVESKNTEADDSSHLLSMSAIEKALNEINSEDSIDFRHKFSLASRGVRPGRQGAEAQATKSPSISKNREKEQAGKENRIPSVTTTVSCTPYDETLVTDSVFEFTGGSHKLQTAKSKNLLQVPTTSTLARRKRSHSSTRLDGGNASDQEIPARRSRSPSTHLELAVTCGSRTLPGIVTPSKLQEFRANSSSPSSDHTMTETDRRFLIDSKSPDCGKFSLPNYGAVTRQASSFSNNAIKSRCNSQCSSSSEFSHRDGKLPIKANVLELSWGSVKLRKTVHKSIQIKNTSNKRLVMRADVSGPGFQLSASTSEPSNLIMLHSQECRTLNLSFCPTVIGAAAGQLLFLPPYGSGSDGQQSIQLYGYGGHSNIIPRGILKGPIGSPYLPLGELRQLSNNLHTTFTLFNKGPLNGFVCIMVDSIGLELPRICDCIDVEPKNTLITPEDSVSVTVHFRPRREDIKKIYKKLMSKNTDVITLANLKMICGDNVTRLRIRNLIGQMNDSERTKFEGTSLSSMLNEFTNEQPIHQLDMLKEKAQSAFELLTTLRTHDISITLNHSILENTVNDSFLFSENDESIFFRTISGNESVCSSSRGPSPRSRRSGSLEMDANSVESWSVRPNKIEIDPTDSATEKATISIQSHFFLRKPFRIDTKYQNIFQFSPQSGNLMPGEEIQVKIHMRSGFLPNESLQISVHLGDTKMNLPVIIKKDNLPAHLR